MGVIIRTISDLFTFVATHIGTIGVGLRRGSLVGTRITSYGTRKASTLKFGRLSSLLDSTWAFSMLFESLEMIVVSDWETNGNDSIVGICLYTSSVFLGHCHYLSLKINLELEYSYKLDPLQPTWIHT